MKKPKMTGAEVWAVIPARGGSKSIPLKNMAILGGRPLIDYVIETARRCACLHRILCSTDHPDIKAYCIKKSIEVHERPVNLAGDQAYVVDVLIHLLEDLKQRENRWPELVVLFQPTSPFVLPEHVEVCVDSLVKDHCAMSAQTIASLPHNYHAYNQREIVGGYVDFKFVEQRKMFWNKQKKPKFYVFGNLVVAKTLGLIEQRQIFATPSIPHVIKPPYAIDVDGPEDLEMASVMLASGLVKLS